ncbi:MAG: ATP-binding protein [Thermoprotei archaeon]|nr:MAG: ATP-binding protein [Thermoprotei archaeon]
MSDLRIGIIFETTTTESIKFRVFPHCEHLITVGSFVKVPNYDKKCSGDDYALARVVHVTRKNYLAEEKLVIHLTSDEYLEHMRERGYLVDNITEITIATAVIVGRVVDGRFEKPKIPPKPFDYVYFADDEFIKSQLLSAQRSESHIVIGYIRGHPRIPATIDADRLVTQHCAILAATGGGKSWTAAVICEELCHRFNIPIVIIDPHGEYSSMQVPAYMDPFCKYSLSEEERKLADLIASRVKVFVPARVSTEIFDKYFEKRFGVKRRYTRVGVYPRLLSFRALVKLLDYYYGITEAQKRVLEEGWKEIQIGDLSGVEFEDVDELIDEVIRRGEHAAPPGPGGKMALQSLETKLRLLFRNRPFFITTVGEEFRGEQIKLLNMKEILLERGIAVFDLSGLDRVDQQAFASVILDSIFYLATQRKIPPTFIIVEEAHVFAPVGEDAPSKYSLMRIASEGRKFMIGLCIISQRPSRVDPNITSQCMTQIFKRMINPKDLHYVKMVSESITESDILEIKALSDQDALVTGVSVPFTLPIVVRKRYTAHGGAVLSLRVALEMFGGV